MEKEGDLIKTLFHGVNGSRILPFDMWIDADRKLVSDGSGGTKYESGFHIFLTHGKAEEYLKKFRTPRNRIIIRCETKAFKGKITNKDVFLAPRIFIPKQKL